MKKVEVELDDFLYEVLTIAAKYEESTPSEFLAELLTQNVKDIVTVMMDEKEVHPNS